MADIMIDIETMDSSPTAAVVAIGARVFTKEKIGKGFEVYIDPTSAAMIGTTGRETMEWWRKQKNYEQVFSGKNAPAAAFHALLTFIQEHKATRVWAYSPQFDVIILRHMARQVGLKFPFTYKDERDARTLIKLAGDHGLMLEDCWNEVGKHLPLDDATAQAKAIHRILNRVSFTSLSAQSQPGDGKSPASPKLPTPGPVPPL